MDSTLSNIKDRLREYREKFDDSSRDDDTTNKIAALWAAIRKCEEFHNYIMKHPEWRFKVLPAMVGNAFQHIHLLKEGTVFYNDKDVSFTKELHHWIDKYEKDVTDIYLKEWKKKRYDLIKTSYSRYENKKLNIK